MRFEFANAVLDVLLSRTFEKSCVELVDAFVTRARSLYGAK
jgi:ribosome-associated toxin RatA of RatAB toxin-antitoxin module